MKRSNRLVILVGVLLAILAFVAIVVLLNQRPTAEVEPTTETVLVATADIAVGQPVTPDLVEEQQVEPDAVTGTALRSASQLQGQPALQAVPAGAQVTDELISGGGDICISCRLNPTEKAVAFQVDRATGLDFLVQEGDTIDIVISQQISVLQETADSAANPDAAAPPRFETVTGLENQRTVKAVLQDRRVIYVSATRAVAPEPVDSDGDGTPDEVQPEQAAIDNVIIVFAGNAQDAEVIKFAQNDVNETGAMTAIVRHAEDDALEETFGITLDELVETYGLRIPNIIEGLTEEVPAP